MTIKTKLTFNEYLNLIFLLTYRKPVNILLSIIGLVMFFGAILYFIGVSLPIDEPPYIALLLGFLIVVVSPLSTYIASRRAFYSHTSLRETIMYEFEDDKIRVTGEAFNSELTWSSIYKVLELKHWILIYQSKVIANIIPKQSFQGTQLTDFRELVKNSNVKAKLRY